MNFIPFKDAIKPMSLADYALLVMIRVTYQSGQGDTHAIGKTITIEGKDYVVIGFRHVQQADHYLGDCNDKPTANIVWNSGCMGAYNPPRYILSEVR